LLRVEPECCETSVVDGDNVLVDCDSSGGCGVEIEKK